MTTDTTELDRQLQIIKSGKAAEIQDFIDWLSANDHAIVRRCVPEYDGDKECLRGLYDRYCHRCENTGYVGPVYNFEKLMANYFGIDLAKIETERRALLKELRGRD